MYMKHRGLLDTSSGPAPGLRAGGWYDNKKKGGMAGRGGHDAKYADNSQAIKGAPLIACELPKQFQTL
jgi:hypothetical protein